MKKLLSLIILFFLFHLLSSAQSSTDIGGEFQKYPHGSIYNLHVAFNVKLNHSIQFRFGHNNIPGYSNEKHIEFAKGWGGGLGYRYYFKSFPKKFFIGGRLDAWSMKIETDMGPAAGPYLIPEYHLIFQPALETGYTFIVNDRAYFTPYISAGYQTLQKDPHLKIGHGFTPAAGISAGIRL